MGNRGPGAHRRIQSQQVQMGMGMPGASFGGMGSFGLGGGVGLGLGNQVDNNGVPKVHGRRHSVNVINKNAEQNAYYAPPVDSFDDGFLPHAGGHSRQASRADTGWRSSKYRSLAT